MEWKLGAGPDEADEPLEMADSSKSTESWRERESPPYKSGELESSQLKGASPTTAELSKSPSSSTNGASGASIVETLQLSNSPNEHARAPEGEQTEQPPKPPTKPQRAAAVIREVLPADGEYRPAAPIHARLAECGLDDPSSITGATAELLKQGFALTKGRLGKQRGERAIWALTATEGAQIALEPADEPADEKPAASGQLMDAALRWNEGRA